MHKLELIEKRENQTMETISDPSNELRRMNKKTEVRTVGEWEMKRGRDESSEKEWEVEEKIWINTQERGAVQQNGSKNE